MAIHPSPSRGRSIVELLFPLLLVALAIAAVLNVRKVRRARAAPPEPPTPIAHTPDGQPIYPIVGYTPDGQPVTADRAVGFRPASSGTNSMAVVALIMGLTIAPLGIIFGHVGLSQINRTGEGGRGLAIAGLILGYIGLAAWIVLIVFYASIFTGGY